MILPLSTALMLQQDTSAPTGVNPIAAMFGTGFMLVSLALVLLLVASMWKVFQKAGEPGWAAIVPLYNIVVLLKIAGKPAWWFLLFLIPGVNFIIAIIVTLALAKNFGKSAGFGLGLIFLSPIFYPMLAWGDSTYSPTQTT
jgi:Family of unknown function (DUF5684)